MKTKHTLLTGLALLSLPAVVQAQLHIDGGGFHIASGAVVAVRGDVTSNGTDITGDGTLMMNGTGAQNLGMNGGDIPVLEINNTSSNVTLTSAARIEDGLTLTAGNVLLGNNNLIFDPSAGATGGAAGRALVTNGTGFVQKEDLLNGASFTAPVAVAAGGINQAVVTNSAATRDFSIQVKTYSQSAPTEGNVTNGIDRTWQIFSDVAGTATVALQHEASSEGATFNRNIAYVTQQIRPNIWSVGTGAAPTAPNFTHTGSFTVPAAGGTTSYFSKADDANSLTSVVVLAVKAYLEGAVIAANTMKNELQQSSLLPTNDPYPGVAATYPAINNPAGPAGAITDWVLVQVVDAANPETVLEQKALLMQTDGDIVDVEGLTPFFTPQAGNVRIALRHRNHLPIVSNQYVAGTSPFGEGYKSYNFSSSQSQAYKLPSDPNQQVLTNSTLALYAGETIQDDIIDGADFSDVQAAFTQLLFGYNRQDITLDGIVDNADYSFIQKNLQLLPNSVLLNF